MVGSAWPPVRSGRFHLPVRVGHRDRHHRHRSPAERSRFQVARANAIDLTMPTSRLSSGLRRQHLKIDRVGHHFVAAVPRVKVIAGVKGGLNGLGRCNPSPMRQNQ